MNYNNLLVYLQDRTPHLCCKQFDVNSYVAVLVVGQSMAAFYFPTSVLFGGFYKIHYGD